MSAHRKSHAGWALLRRELLVQRRALLRILGWSLVEALPSLLSGIAVSAAVSGLLAGDAVVGFGAIAALTLAGLIAAVAARRVVPLLTQLMGPVQTALVTAVVDGAVARAAVASGSPDTAAIARLTEQTEAVRDILFGMLRTVRPVLFNCAAALVGLAALAPPAALYSTVLVGAAVIIFVMTLPGLAHQSRLALLAEEEIAGRSGSAFAGLRDVLACGAQHRIAANLGGVIDLEAGLTRRIANRTAVRSLIVFVGGQLPLLLILLAAPWLVRSGQLTAAEIVGAATYLAVAVEPALRDFVFLVGGWGVGFSVNLDRLAAGFAGRPDATGPVGRSGTGNRIEVRRLTFSYGSFSEPVIRRLDLCLEDGDHLAVVGPSGAGKSTLGYLLAGLLTPSSGTVRLGGVPLARLSAPELRRHIGVIPQEAYVFAGTLRENLSYLRSDVTDGDLEMACDVVGLRPVVDRLGGFGAPIGAGNTDLSQGERQLVALVRMYLSPAQIVILDEATSSLDPVAEERAEAAFAGRRGTLIVIAHRISSARRANRILVLDGSEVALADHDALLRTSPLYADLVGSWGS